MIKYIRNTFDKYQIIIHNIMYMNVLKVITLVVPLLTYPYLIKTLGAEKFGLIIWAWIIVDFFIIFINFAFDISITKHISINRDNKLKLSKIFSSVLYIKLIFLLIAFLIFHVLIYTNDTIFENRILFYASFLIVLPEVFMPLWYFRGIEEMKYVAFITSFTKICFALLVFLIIKNENDYLIVPILYAISGIISAGYANYYILYKKHVTLTKVSFQRMYFYIYESIPLFGSNSLFLIKEKISIVLIEKLLGLESVAYFHLIQKFIEIVITPFHIVGFIIYPLMARTKNIIFLKKVILLSFIIGFTVYIIQYILSENIVEFLYGQKNEMIQIIMNIMALNILFGQVSAYIGLNILTVFNKNKEVFQSSLFATVIYFVLIWVFWFFELNINLIVFTVISVVSYFAEMNIRIFFARNLLFNKFKRSQPKT